MLTNSNLHVKYLISSLHPSKLKKKLTRSPED